jgi:hypothetical protein
MLLLENRALGIKTSNDGKIGGKKEVSKSSYVPSTVSDRSLMHAPPSIHNISNLHTPELGGTYAVVLDRDK